MLLSAWGSRLLGRAARLCCPVVVPGLGGLGGSIRGRITRRPIQAAAMPMVTPMTMSANGR
jgi:hypothetical protein